MKNTFIKPIAFIFAIALTFTLASCSSEPNPTADKNDSGEKQIYLPYTSLHYSENCKYTYEYDEYGNEIKRIQENLNGERLATWSYEYDEDQNLIKRTVDTGDGTPFVQLEQTYDDNGNLLEKREYTTNGETVFTYEYDSPNRVISEKKGETLTETYTYEADGSYKVQSASDPNEYSLYNKDGQMTERHISETVKVIISYNGDGILTESATYSDNDISAKQVYQLDEHGNAIKVTLVSASGEETVLSEYEYKQYTVKAK